MGVLAVVLFVVAFKPFHDLAQLVRWPGKIKPGTIINDMFAHQDWMPTLLAAANGGVDTGIQEKLKKGGVEADGKTFEAHLDGYNQLDLLTGKGPGARKEFLYFSGNGDLNAIRLGEWKIVFTEMWGALPTTAKATSACWTKPSTKQMPKAGLLWI